MHIRNSYFKLDIPQSKLMETQLEEEKYQVVVCNIYWSSSAKTYQARRDYRDSLPAQMSIDIPKQVLEQAKKDSNSFNDIVEQFCYNLLARKFGREVNSCQIWLPLSR